MIIARHVRRRLLILSVSTLGFFISSFSAVLALDFTGPVVSVLDGDTIEVLHNQRPERIRLSGIDCPEKAQAHGKRAKQAASELVFGKKVTLQTFGKDKYGRSMTNVSGCGGWCRSRHCHEYFRGAAIRGDLIDRDRLGSGPRHARQVRRHTRNGNSDNLRSIRQELADRINRYVADYDIAIDE
jgi:hypothetical protein